MTLTWSVSLGWLEPPTWLPSEHLSSHSQVKRLAKRHCPSVKQRAVGKERCLLDSRPGRNLFILGLDGCEVRPCDPCARVRPCVPCESRPPVLFTFSVYSYFGGSVHTPATFGVVSFGAHTRESRS